MKNLIHSHLISGLLIVPVIFLSCSTNQTEERSITKDKNVRSKEQSSRETSAQQSDFKDPRKETQQKKLIKTGNLSLKSENIGKSKAHLDQVLKSIGGYYDKEQFSKSGYEFRYSLKLRIPAKNFDQVLSSVDGGTDEIVSKNIRTEDVSGEYVDLTARLKSKRAYLTRYEELLTKAKDMDELLQIENQMRLLIEEIESQESRLNYLDDQVGYSTLDIELYKTIEHPVFSKEPGFAENALAALSNGWTGIVVFLLGLLSIWPLLLILIPVGIFTYRKLKSQKN